VTHLDHDRLILIAIGQQTADRGEERHLTACAACREDLTRTTTVAGFARYGEDLGQLPAPSPALWDRVAAEAFAQPAASPQPISTTGASTRPGGPTRPPSRQTGRSSGRRIRLVLVALVALVVGIAGTAGMNWLLGRDQAHIVAQADLAPQAAAPSGARGKVQVVDTGHGLQLRVTMTGMPTPTGYYTVWLYDGGSVMIPVGSPGSAGLNVPAAATNLDRFHIVDISAQQLGQQEHGISMLQGTLHR
jgi:hypothetical protein